jgi:DNA-binding transcriptional LysR family regulator
MNNPAKILDIDTVRAFVLVADLGSFTRAAEALDTAQATVSLKLKRLEGLLGHRLLERTPRHVALSGDGERFLPAARNLLDAHQRALAGVRTAPPSRLTLGISDHVAGAELPTLLARLNAYDPTLVVEVRVSSSRDVIARYGQGELDAAIARRGEEGADGETLFREPFGWFAAPSFAYRPGEPLRLATLAAPVHWPSTRWTRPACRGRKRLSAAGFWRSARRLAPGLPWPRWRIAWRRPAPSRSAKRSACRGYRRRMWC